MALRIQTEARRKIKELQNTSDTVTYSNGVRSFQLSQEKLRHCRTETIYRTPTSQKTLKGMTGENYPQNTESDVYWYSIQGNYILYFLHLHL